MERFRTFTSLIALTLLIGCAQTQAARELANKTNAAALSVKFQIEDFAETQKRVSELEADRMGEFLRSTVEIETDLKKAITASPSAIYLNTQTRARELVAAEAEASEQANVLRQDLLGLLEAFELPSGKIDTLSEKLTVLGEEKSFEEKIAFFIAFGTSVKEAIDTAKARRDKALKEAAGNR